jgi:hypothetical protein
MNEPDNPITIALREIAEQADPPGLSADAAWRAGRRRRWAAMAGSAATVAAAAVLVPLAVRGVIAAAPTTPAAASGAVTTLTETTSSPAGTMTVQVRYRSAQAGARLLSITYSGSLRRSRYVPAHPALVFTLKKPVAPDRVQLVVIVVKLTRRELRHFAGSVPLRPSVQGLPVVASTLTAVLGGPFSPITHHEHSTMQNSKRSQFHVLIQEVLLIIVRN